MRRRSRSAWSQALPSQVGQPIPKSCSPSVSTSRATPTTSPPRCAGGVCLTWEGHVARIADDAAGTPIAVVPASNGRHTGRTGRTAQVGPSSGRCVHASHARRCSVPRSRRARRSSSPRRSDDRLHEPYRASQAPLLVSVRAATAGRRARRNALRLGPDRDRVGSTTTSTDSCAAELRRTLPDAERPSTLDLTDRSEPAMSNPYDRPSDPAKRHSAALTDGVDRAAARAMLKGTGFDDDDLARPIVGVATTWIETMPCNLNQRELAADVKRGIRAAGGTPMEFNTIAVSDGVSMGTRGHASLARLARGDRRLDRARRARPPLRRARLPRRLRQDDSRRRDGARAARPAGARALQRLDRARPLPWARRHDPGRLRSGRRACRRHDERGGGARARGRRVSRRRRVRRPVHGEHDVDWHSSSSASALRA